MDIDSVFNFFIQEDRCAAIFGEQIPVYMGKKISRRYVWENFSGEDPVENPTEKSGEYRYFFHNAFSIINKSAWEEFKFDRKLPGKEDRYWAADVIESGMKIFYFPHISCNHFWTPGGATWKGIG